MTLSIAEQERKYDALKDGTLYTAPELVLADDDDDEAEPDYAAEDAANQQKVYELIKSAFESKSSAPLFVDTLPGHVNDVPLDLVVAVRIGALLERNVTTLGITREQLFEILHVAVIPVMNEYLITPARRMQLVWDGME